MAGTHVDKQGGSQKCVATTERDNQLWPSGVLVREARFFFLHFLVRSYLRGLMPTNRSTDKELGHGELD
jgi:hypothetical protein